MSQQYTGIYMTVLKSLYFGPFVELEYSNAIHKVKYGSKRYKIAYWNWTIRNGCQWTSGQTWHFYIFMRLVWLYSNIFLTLMILIIPGVTIKTIKPRLWLVLGELWWVRLRLLLRTWLRIVILPTHWVVTSWFVIWIIDAIIHLSEIFFYILWLPENPAFWLAGKSVSEQMNSFNEENGKTQIQLNAVSFG